MKSKFVVIGLGKSGIGAARLLKQLGNEVIIIEKEKNQNIEITANKIKNEGIKVELGIGLEMNILKNKIGSINEIESLIISPGIPWEHETLTKLRQNGVNIKSEMSLAWELLKDIPWIGITGTNGKTTITHLINHILTDNNFFAPMGGNIGYSATSIALDIITKKIRKPDFIVMEISSYQIEAGENIFPRIGICSNITPDHLERHKTFEKYRRIKLDLLKRSTSKILNGDDIEIRKESRIYKDCIWVGSKKYYHERNCNNFWVNERGILMEKNEEIFNTSMLKISGSHNIENVLLATAAAREIGISAEDISKSLITFKGIPHRLESIFISEKLNIINDSKATNFEAARIGLKAISGPSIIIIGGRIKKGNPSSWLSQLKKSSKAIIIFGESSSILYNLIKKSGFEGKSICCKDLNDAFLKSIDLSKKINIKNIILSPACSSFDQYKDFEERGNHFKTLTAQLDCIKSTL